MRYLRPITILFFLLLTVEIIADSLGYYIVGWICKPMLMPLLIGFFYANAQHNTKAEQRYFPMALVFSLIGDVLLMMHQKSLFVFGLASFLIAHIFFISSYVSRIKGRQIAISQWLLSLLPFALYVGVFLSVLVPGLKANEQTKGLVMPVTAYACVLGIMGYTALMRKGGVSNQGFLLVITGAAFFIISDSFIALNHFISPIPQPTFLIMSTYGVAQYLITLGMLKK